MFRLVLLAIEEKSLLKTFEIAIGLEIVVPSIYALLGLSTEMFSILKKDLETVHTFLILFQ